MTLSERQEMHIRNREVDALRGVALLGICVVNIPFLAGLNTAVLPELTLDRAAVFIVALFFQGKFFLLFSFFFGWGVAVQIASAKKSHSNFNSRYIRRLLVLASLGVVHALLVFVGDILLLYALLGFLLLLVRSASVGTLLRIAISLIVLEFVTLNVLALLLSDPVPVSDVASGYLGTFADVIRQRWMEWPYGFGFVFLFNGPAALAAFCLGLAAAKVDFFRVDAPAYCKLKTYWPCLLVIGIALNLAYALSTVGVLGFGLPALFAFSALAVAGPCLSAVYLIFSVELSRRGALLGSQASGRMSLTAYVSQGVLAGLIFNGYGLGYFEQTGAALCFVIAVLIFAVVHWSCVAWLRWFEHGPLESLMRLVTHGWNSRNQDRDLKV